MSLIGFLKKLFLKFNSKEDKRGEVLIKDKTLYFLKKNRYKNIKNKWQKVNTKNNESCLDAMFEI